MNDKVIVQDYFLFISQTRMVQQAAEKTINERRKNERTIEQYQITVFVKDTF